MKKHIGRGRRPPSFVGRVQNSINVPRTSENTDQKNPTFKTIFTTLVATSRCVLCLDEVLFLSLT